MPGCCHRAGTWRRPLPWQAHYRVAGQPRTDHGWHETAASTRAAAPPPPHGCSPAPGAAPPARRGPPPSMPTSRPLDAGQVADAAQQPARGPAGLPLQAAPAGLQQLAHRLQRAAVEQRLAAVAKRGRAVRQRALADRQRLGALRRGVAARVRQARGLLCCQHKPHHQLAALAGAGRRRLCRAEAQHQPCAVAAVLRQRQRRRLARPLLRCRQRLLVGGPLRRLYCRCDGVAAGVAANPNRLRVGRSVQAAATVASCRVARRAWRHAQLPM